MVSEKCMCGCGQPRAECPVGGGNNTPTYWCEVCEREVAEKRCPLCGLKARKLRPLK